MIPPNMRPMGDHGKEPTAADDLALIQQTPADLLSWPGIETDAHEGERHYRDNQPRAFEQRSSFANEPPPPMGCCYYCGSWHPRDVYEHIRTGRGTIGGTDKAYKMYVYAKLDKEYDEYITPEEITRLKGLIDDGKDPHGDAGFRLMRHKAYPRSIGKFYSSHIAEVWRHNRETFEYLAKAIYVSCGRIYFYDERSGLMVRGRMQ